MLRILMWIRPESVPSLDLKTTQSSASRGAIITHEEHLDSYIGLFNMKAPLKSSGGEGLLPSWWHEGEMMNPGFINRLIHRQYS